jgi:hypothetical protein
LNADEGDHAASTAKLAGDAGGLDPGIGFVEGADLDFDVIAKDVAGFAIQREAVKYGQ